MAALFNTLIHQPLYNGLVFLVSVVPLHDVGLAVIALTIIVKFILFPLDRRAKVMQAKIREITPQIDALKEQHKDDSQAQTLAMLALYKEHNIRPFASILALFVQIPIILGLYYVFWKGGLPAVHIDELYSFVTPPSVVNMDFLGIFNMAERSIILAVLAGATQFFQGMLTLPPPPTRGDSPSLKDDLAHSFHLQMRYAMPVIVGVIAYTISAAVALYWIVNNLFSMAQEWYIRLEHRS
jgi:YidC/Oxa1 family membrane protein insertase